MCAEQAGSEFFAAAVPPAGLAARLRAATAASHAALEQRMGGLQTLATTAGYAACLARHHAVFAALEPPLASFSGWPAAGIDLLAHQRLPHLRADLAALRFDLGPFAPPALPPPASFPAALGTLYVLEGASLGGQIILRAARARLGGAIDGATAFFGGGPHRPAWPVFKSRLDEFGAAQPAAEPAVIAGALAAFAAFG